MFPLNCQPSWLGRYFTLLLLRISYSSPSHVILLQVRENPTENFLSLGTRDNQLILR
jgi:hypothetical protein